MTTRYQQIQRLIVSFVCLLLLTACSQNSRNNFRETLWSAQSNTQSSTQSKTGLSASADSRRNDKITAGISQSKLQDSQLNLFSNLIFKKLDLSSLLLKKADGLTYKKADYLLWLTTRGQLLLCQSRSTSLCAVVTEQRSILNFAVSPDDRFLILQEEDSRDLTIYDISSGTVASRLTAVDEAISALVFNLDSQSVFLGTLPGKIYHWYFTKNQQATEIAELTRYSGHASIVEDIIAHPSNRLFFSYDVQGKISAWQIYAAIKERYDVKNNLFDPRFWSEQAVRVRRQVPAEISSLAITKDGQYLFLAKKNDEIEVWSVRGFVKRCRLQTKITKIKHLLFNDSDNSLIVYNSTRAVSLKPSAGNWNFSDLAYQAGGDQLSCREQMRQTELNLELTDRIVEHGGKLYSVSSSLGIKQL